jgi:hypothetical protein
MAEDWKRKSVLKSWAISRTSRWKGNFLIKSSVDFYHTKFYQYVKRSNVVAYKDFWKIPDIYEFHEERQYQAYNDGAS